MKQATIEKLAQITEEEKRLEEGHSSLRRELYSRSSNFLIEKRRLPIGTYGEPDSPLVLRTHTRFADFPAHSHDYVELMYVCHGSITHLIGNEEIALSAGDLLLLGKSSVHAIRRAGREDIGINIIISYDFYASLCNKLRSSTLLTDKILTRLNSSVGNPYCVFHTAGSSEVENLLENMISPLLTGQPKNSTVLQVELELLISYLATLPEICSQAFVGESRNEQAMRRLNAYIETTYPSATLVEAAEHIGVTPTSLCRWIKKHFGITFKELLTEKRFSVATELLMTTSLSVSEIIQMIGYENSSYFHKEFRRRYGKTPKAIREETNKL